MRTAWLMLGVHLLMTSCECRSPDVALDGRSKVAETMAAPAAPSARELLQVVTRYYPRWDRDRETLEDYLMRYDQTPEIIALKALVASKLEDDAPFQALLRDIRAAFPDYSVIEGNPPSLLIPSYQVVIAFEHPPGSSGVRHMVFRLSHLAPIYDYHETDRARNKRIVARRLEPSTESQHVYSLVARKITEHFGYHRLSPGVGSIQLLDVQVGNFLPGHVTLADALFDESPTW